MRRTSTDIIAYRYKEEPAFTCPACRDEVLKAGFAEEKDYTPYFEDDRQGWEMCDVCFAML